MKEFFFDQLALRFSDFYQGDQSFTTLDRIRAYVADPDAKSPAVAELAATRQAAQERARNRAKAEQRAKADAERCAQRRDAAPILALLEGATPRPATDFSAYRFGKLLTDLYEGTFEPFTGDHSQIDTLGQVWQVGAAFGAMVGDPNWRAEAERMEQGLARIEDFARRGTPVKLAFKVYHEAYAEICRRAPSTVSWRQLTFRRDFVQRKSNGAVLSRIKGEPVTIEVREPFAEVFEGAYSFAADPGFFGATAIDGGISAFSRRLHEDFVRFLSEAGCNSPAARHLEVNLYLVYRWLPPARELLE